MRGATQSFCLMYPPPLFQATRPMRGATADHAAGAFGVDVSIHAPHAGRDVDAVNNALWQLLFQSTRPMRGATGRGYDPRCTGCVSIHAPHAGRDAHWHILLSFGGSFNPRAPCGARRGRWSLSIDPTCFNPRAPCGARRNPSPMMEEISKFQSTRPMRGATGRGHRRCGQHRVSIHAPHAGRDSDSAHDTLFRLVSIHAPHAGRDISAHPQVGLHIGFNPRAPCGARQ